MANLNPQAEKETAYDKNNPKKNLWIWGCGGSIVAVCVVLGLALGFLFYTSTQPPLLDGIIQFQPQLNKVIISILSSP